MLTGTVPKLPNGRAKAITKTRNSKTRKIGFKILPKEDKMSLSLYAITKTIAKKIAVKTINPPP